jgi:tRNA(Arg) A34 adenosine deaminase TadA
VPSRWRRGRARTATTRSAVLIGPTGKVLVDQENGYMPDRDMTAHAERLLRTVMPRESWASRNFSASYRSKDRGYWIIRFRG